MWPRIAWQCWAEWVTLNYAAARLSWTRKELELKVGRAQAKKKKIRPRIIGTGTTV